MDITCKSKKRVLQMERVLKAVPADLRVKMEALVHDLTLALEESSNSANLRRRWGIRRRARSTGNIRKSALSMNKHSDDSSSSICEIRIPKTTNVSKYQSDSDDTNQTKRFAHFPNLNNISNIESDSVNENFVPKANTRRKRKFKRMAIDSDSNASTSQAVAIMSTSTFGGKKRIFRSDCKNRYGAIWCGKRKRSCRERSIDCEMRVPKPMKNAKPKNRDKMQGEDTVDCSRLSSSSISSSDSEEGLITNDEDREGDDEQSDWIGESSWRDDGESTSDDKATSDSTFQMILHGGEHSITEAKKNYRQRIQRIREGLSGREIRAGRRHVDNKPGYSIITSANEKVSRFLQDPTQSELKLHPMRQPEREKLRRLANLYSLSLKGDLGCPILYKTRHTTQAVCVDQVSLNRFSDYKRLRKTPPNSPNSDSTMQTEEIQISSTSFDSQIINQAQNNVGPIQANVQTYSSFEWESESMDIEVQGKSKFSDFGHSKSS
ncbi:G patch domain-containing protein 2-like isoform X3 [Pogonomyrmex barbatus]|uniref:G patch domain-containing protein 2-like isoform X3 n=1 Tax=Pogonomyrmex barbatus TaxID=144034 RepID=A0A6I9W306_9HYME|nr:G patch domain-containing protein 2-like isoform X3 [Pogonomyrmex barbatus]